MKKFALLGCLCALVLAGCTSSSTNPPDDVVSFLSKKTGTYILMQNTISSKTQAGADTVLATYADSVVYSGDKLTTDSEGMSKTAAQYIAYISGAPTDTNAVSEGDGKVYWLFSLGTTVPGLGNLDFGTRWVLAADQKNGSWNAMKDTIAGIPVTYSGIPLTIDVYTNLDGNFVGKENLTINGATVETSHFRLTYTLNLGISASGLGTIPAAPIVMPIDIWFLKDVGVVKMVRGVSKLELGGLVGQTVYIPGAESVATKYFVP